MYSNKYNILLVGNTVLEAFCEAKINTSKYSCKLFKSDMSGDDKSLISYISENKIHTVISLTQKLHPFVRDYCRTKSIKIIESYDFCEIDTENKLKMSDYNVNLNQNQTIVIFIQNRKIVFAQPVNAYYDNRIIKMSGVLCPAKIKSSEIVTLNNYIKQISQKLITDKYNGIFFLSFANGKTAVKHNFDDNIQTCLTVFSYYMNNNDIIDILVKNKCREHKPEYHENYTASLLIDGISDNETIQILNNNGIQTYFVNNCYRKNLIALRTSSSPFADIYEITDKLKLQTIKFDRRAGYPDIYNESFCKKLDESQYSEYLNKIYKLHFDRSIDFSNPKRFTEKIQYLKLYNTTSMKTLASDKLNVKKYIADVCPELKIAKLYTAQKNALDINFNLLPESYILKTNHSCKTNIKIFRNSKLLKSKKLREQIIKYYNYHLKVNYAFCSGFELQYKDIEPCVFAEELIGPREKSTLTDTDIKVHCFNGEPLFIERIINNNGVAEILFTDTNLKRTGYYHTYREYAGEIPVLINLELILDYARRLSKPFKYVRCDLIPDGDNIWFCELTFSPSSGFMYWYPDNADYKLGEYIHI